MLLIAITTIILIVSIIVALQSYDFDFLGLIFASIAGVVLFIQILCFLTTSYDYNQFVVKRNAFESTLQESRKSGNPYETAAIVKEVSDWNVKLATKQYDNKNIFFSDFEDDRVDSLKPIK